MQNSFVICAIVFACPLMVISDDCGGECDESQYCQWLEDGYECVRRGPCSDKVEDHMEFPPDGELQPQCTSKGFHSLIGSHASTAYFYCVHPETGKFIESTGLRPDQGTLQESDCPKCLQDLNKIFEEDMPYMPGRFMPKCDESTGLYEKFQSQSTGFSWCVDEQTGEEIANTKVQGVANCGDEPMPDDCNEECDESEYCLMLEQEYECVRTGPCSDKLKEDMESSLPSMVLRDGELNPQCTFKGYHKLVGSHGSTGYFYCVHPETGKYIESTGMRLDEGTLEEADCPKCLQQLRDIYAEDLPMMPGRVIPQCNAETGLFERVQGNGSTGYRYCVDDYTGDKIEGSDVPPPQEPDC